MRLKKPQILLPVLSLLICMMPMPLLAYEEPEFPPLDLQLNDPTALLSESNASLDKNAMIKVYYDYCKKSNESPEFKAYMDIQCTCTAAEMTNLMSENQVQNMFENSRTGDFEYARMMLLAYVPCMGQTVKQYVFDVCSAEVKPNMNKYKHNQLCECSSKAMADHVLKVGQSYIPGFNRDSFQKSETIANPLGYVLTRKSYQRKYNNELYACSIKLVE